MILFIVRLLGIFMLFIPFSDQKTAQLRSNIQEKFMRFGTSKSDTYKSLKFEISDDGFLRYTKIYTGNKKEYYSVKLTKLLDLDYQGTEEKGNFVVLCEEETVIFQTYNDPGGNIDSMTNKIIFTFNQIDIEELNQLKRDLTKIKDSYQLP